ncbi:MAG: lactate utilization protein, partial [Planctomycetes bacterium]|nr:lactate utilization protein [Planctomycetota bacterium]
NGALVLTTGPAQPRLLQLAPPVHFCLVNAESLHADLFDLLKPQNLSSSLNLVAGPSKTSDIEMKLVTGVHGPIEEHIFILE